MRFYHRTSKKNAAAILRGGFRDRTATYMTDIPLTGVWVSDRIVDADQRHLDTVLEVDIDCEEEAVDHYELKEDPPNFYREWCIPASFLNSKAIVKVIEE
jgi:hypothetical protein